MGFEEQINKVLSLLPHSRQTVLFSATFPPSVQEARSRWLKSPMKIKLQDEEGGAGGPRINPSIQQVVHVLGEHKKHKKLIKFVEQVAEKDKRKRGHSRILVFVKNNKTAEFLCKFISEKAGRGSDKVKRADHRPGKDEDVPNEDTEMQPLDVPPKENVAFRCATLHGKMTQPQRERTLNDFKAAKVPILIATDLASRGLHIPALPYVVNYDFPGNLE